jgi:hypothetical protein
MTRESGQSGEADMDASDQVSHKGAEAESQQKEADG